MAGVIPVAPVALLPASLLVLEALPLATLLDLVVLLPATLLALEALLLTTLEVLAPATLALLKPLPMALATPVGLEAMFCPPRTAQ